MYRMTKGESFFPHLLPRAERLKLLLYSTQILKMRQQTRLMKPLDSHKPVLTLGWIEINVVYKRTSGALSKEHLVRHRKCVCFNVAPGKGMLWRTGRPLGSVHEITSECPTRMNCVSLGGHEEVPECQDILFVWQWKLPSDIEWVCAETHCAGWSFTFCVSSVNLLPFVPCCVMFVAIASLVFILICTHPQR